MCSVILLMIMQMVPHYHAQGVRLFSLWNEPNLGAFLCVGHLQEGKTIDDTKCVGSTTAKMAKTYTELYKAGYDAIRHMGLHDVKVASYSAYIFYCRP